MNNSDYQHRKFPIRPQFVIVAVILLLVCIIVAIPLARKYGTHKQQSAIQTTPTPNMVTTITLPKVPTTAATGTSAPSSEAKKIEISMLDNIQQNGWDHASSINGGLGGLWINWRYGTSPLQVDLNGTASPDQAIGASLRHDPLTDIRYIHNLWLYKSQNPKDPRYDGDITKYTAIIKVEWANAHDAQRGWLCDEEFSDLYQLSHDSFYLQQMQNLASAYARSINSTAGIFFKSSSAHPGGYYRPSDALETGLALIQAGTQFHNTTWIQLGQNEVNFVYQHAYLPEYHTFPGTMQVANGKKDGGRMMEMLWAFHLADQYGGNYQNMENALLTIALNKVYYAPGHGVMYEMRPDWSLVTIKGIPEDWVTTEAMGIELESLFMTDESHL